jgi:hypothetical protein
MSADVIIPWSGNCVYRASARSHISSRWSSLGFNVIVGEIDGPWCKARAVAEALKVSTADTLVVTDADVWSDVAPLSASIVDDGEARWAVPFSEVRRLSAEASQSVIDGAPFGGRLAKTPFKAVPGGGLVVVGRELYDQAPLDSRFIGWSFEDIAWGQALTSVAGRPRMWNAPLWHLWHPPQDKGPSPERTAATALRARYAKARTNRNLMDELRSEARTALGW